MFFFISLTDKPWISWEMLIFKFKIIYLTSFRETCLKVKSAGGGSSNIISIFTIFFITPSFSVPRERTTENGSCVYCFFGYLATSLQRNPLPSLSCCCCFILLRRSSFRHIRRISPHCIRQIIFCFNALMSFFAQWWFVFVSCQPVDWLFYDILE